MHALDSSRSRVRASFRDSTNGRLWGNRSHFQYLESQLEGDFKVYLAGSNEGYRTYDGIDLCGKRVSLEIEAELKQEKVTKLSVVGYSLGGLIARYAIGILYSKGYFSTLEPVNFVTFCTPHVGVLAHGPVFNTIVPFLLARTGRQLFLQDKCLEQMSQPGSVFFKGLKLFKNRALYGNIVNDKRTNWWTSGICLENPYEDLDVVKHFVNEKKVHLKNGKIYSFEYVENYSPVVLDVSKLPKVVEMEKHDTIPSDSVSDGVLPQMISLDVKRRLHLVLSLIVFSPLWVFWFIISGLVQRTSSTIRVVREQKVIDNFWEDQTDEIIESVLEEQSLKLSMQQVKMVTSLNSLHWQKFPIHITKTTATHAAAIVRHEDPHFHEGKVVVAHFVEQVLQRQ